MPRRRKDIDDGLDSSSESDKELFEISDTLLLEERELFENPSRHKRRKFTKEDAYLGIWAEHDDDRLDRKKKDIHFVASTSKSVTIENDAAKKDYKDIDSSETSSEEVDNIDEDGQKGLLDMTNEQNLKTSPKKRNPPSEPSEEILEYYNEFKSDLIKVRESLFEAIEIGDIPNAEALLPKYKNDGRVKRPASSIILFTNQLNRFGMLEVAGRICEKYQYNKQRKMGLARQLGGIIWNDLPDDIKEYFDRLAKEVVVNHKIKYPEYEFKPNNKRKGMIFKPYYPKDDRPNLKSTEVDLKDDNEDVGGRGGLGLDSSQMDIDEDELGARLTTKKEMLSFASGSASTQGSATLDEMLNIQFSSTKGKGKSQYNTKFQESRNSPPVVDKDFGKFEKHTKGIGLKLMQKMGYKLGEGLGSDGRGIVKPIDPQVRPARMGLAYHGFKEKTKQSIEEKKRQNLIDDDEEIGIKPAKKEKNNAWKKSAKAKRTNISYKTADEIINEIGSDPSVQPIKIIDMTGPQAREISSTSRISSLAIPDTSARLPELRHNLRLIVDISGADLEHFARLRRTQTERTKTLRTEAVKITSQVDNEATKIKRLGEITSIIKDCSRRLTVSLSSDSPSLQFFSDAFEKLQNEYSDELIMYSLDAAVIAIITPVIKQNMIDWDPLEDPNFGLLEFQKWKGLFRTSPPITNATSDRFNYNSSYKRSSEITMTPYESMMYNVWLPKIRSAINNTWNARDYDPAIKLLENWKPPLLPMFIYDNIIDQLIMPKLTREVDFWNPNTDTQMIHQWLHPWLPLLGDRIEPLYLTIRHKFRLSLQRWDPIDTSAIDIIEPWKNVFKPEDMQSLLVKAVLPRLTETIKTRLEINPKNQELEVFNCIMIWKDLFTPRTFNQLFENTFFPKLLDVLYIWLTHNPNYDEIRQWYLFWKSLFPKEMLDSPIIVEQFMKVLYMIEESISLGSEASIRLSHPSQKSTIPGPEQLKLPPEESAAYKNITDIDITFFEIVEEFAQEENFLFLPTNKTHDSGKPLYRMGGTPEGIGGLLMYLSDDVMYVKEDQNWTPMGFEEVLGKLKSSKYRR